eukprot:7675774-Alexandrium_andersonii.AAC.1
MGWFRGLRQSQAWLQQLRVSLCAGFNWLRSWQRHGGRVAPALVRFVLVGSIQACFLIRSASSLRCCVLDGGAPVAISWTHRSR